MLIKILLIFSLQIFPVVEDQILQQEREFERETQKFVQENILDKILGPGKAIAIVDATLAVQTIHEKGEASQEKYQAESPITTETEYILPGLPKPKPVVEEKPMKPRSAVEEKGEKKQATVTVKTSIKDLFVTVIHDENIIKGKLDACRTAIKVALKITDAQIKFEKTKFTAPYSWKDLLNPKILIPLLLATLFLWWLFGPLRNFLKNLIHAIKEQGPHEVKLEAFQEQELKQKTEEETKEEETKEEEQLSEEQQQALTEGGEEEMEKKYLPFSYITNENVDKLLGVFYQEPPEIIAVVLTYIEPGLVKYIFSNFPPELQTKVALEMTKVRQLTEEEVAAVDRDIKEKIDFVIGGLDRFLGILEQLDYKTRNNVLENMKDTEPQMYLKLREALFLFEDLVSLPDPTIQIIIRELKTEDLAKALQNSPPETLEKFLHNMGKGAAALLKEEIDYGKRLLPDQIEEEKDKIMSIVRDLIRQGKIYVERKRVSVFDSKQGGIITSIPKKKLEIDKQKAFEYYYAGTKAYEEANYEEAISQLHQSINYDPTMWQTYQYLGGAYYALGKLNEALGAYEKAVELNPSDENLREWIESFKASIGVIAK